jgi:ABC-type thiamin/hydroxymethylpyrimidine transport system permease subunit
MKKRLFPSIVGVLLAVWSYGAIAAAAHQPRPGTAPVAATVAAPVTPQTPAGGAATAPTTDSDSDDANDGD